MGGVLRVLICHLHHLVVLLERMHLITEYYHQTPEEVDHSLLVNHHALQSTVCIFVDGNNISDPTTLIHLRCLDAPFTGIIGSVIGLILIRFVLDKAADPSGTLRVSRYASWSLVLHESASRLLR